jgi:hypothetical protein
LYGHSIDPTNQSATFDPNGERISYMRSIDPIKVGRQSQKESEVRSYSVQSNQSKQGAKASHSKSNGECILYVRSIDPIKAVRQSQTEHSSYKHSIN